MLGVVPCTARWRGEGSLEVEVPSLASKDTEGFMALFIPMSRRIGIRPGPPWVPSTCDKWNYLSLEIPTERLRRMILRQHGEALGEVSSVHLALNR